jgi:hypothetical protein
LRVVAVLASIQCVLAQPGSKTGRAENLAAQEHFCSTVVLNLRCLRQPPIYHMGETIRARLSFRSKAPRGYTLAGSPEPRRSGFPLEEIIVPEPEAGTIDPLSRSGTIYAGSTLSSFWPGKKSLNREIDVNEWVQFQRPGRYVLHVVSKRIMLPMVKRPTGHEPIRYCELKSNTESVEVLPPDAHWEAAEIARIDLLLQSTSESIRFEGASALRYLNTPDAALALTRWYVELRDGRVNAELREGIFESRYADTVRSKLEQALRSGALVPIGIVDTLAMLEVRRQFRDRPIPLDPKAREVYSREYWEIFESVKRKYAASAGRRVP